MKAKVGSEADKEQLCRQFLETTNSMIRQHWPDESSTTHSSAPGGGVPEEQRRR